MDEATRRLSPLPVVIIGNGPSAICLSYFLSGYRPYFKESSVHPNPILQRKLEANPGRSIVDQNLEFLSEGLEGRSHSPVAVLFDSILRPNADLGVSLDSVLSWRFEPNQYIPHLVLGKGPPGGAWHSIEGSVFTLSLGEWMELPDLPFRDWMRDKRRYLRNDRAMTADVAQYYQHYVQAKQLQENFVCGTIVTSVRRLGREERTCAGSAAHGQASDNPPASLFEVRGYSSTEAGSEKVFSICTENVVLATGTYDSPAWLGVDGEDLPFVHHATSEVETVIKEHQSTMSFDPILIVGAGLTAADAVIAARHGNVPVIHVFRREVNDPGLIFNQLPKLMYPEYHKVHQMMVRQAGTSTGPYNDYLSLPGHQVVHFTRDKKCVLQDLALGESRTANIFMALILIGSEPNLAFLPDGGRSLAVNPELPISTRRNPVDVDCYTYECTRERGMYALGPLVADNFVRFLQGGALATTSALSKARPHANVQSGPAGAQG